MLKLIRISDPADIRLKKLLPLYEEAFPASERREGEQLFRLIREKQEMFFNAVECDGELSGLFIYWRFEEFYYLEHLAVYPEMRNKKIGQQVLDYIAGNLPGLRLLEVEPTDTEIAARRVNYYRRNGYEVLDKHYRQPSYRSRDYVLSLWLMGNKSTDKLEEFKRQIRDEVYWNWC